jgi:hypothetical protein
MLRENRRVPRAETIERISGHKNCVILRENNNALSSQVTAVLPRICAELCDNLLLYSRHLQATANYEVRVVQGHFLNAR